MKNVLPGHPRQRAHDHDDRHRQMKWFKPVRTEADDVHRTIVGVAVIAVAFAAALIAVGIYAT